MNESSSFPRSFPRFAQGLRLTTRSLRLTTERLALAFGLFALGLGVTACGGDEDELPRLPPGSDGGSGVEVEPCDPGAERLCGVTLERSNGTVTCYRGKQTCEAEGTWTRCGDGRVTTEADPLSEATRDFLDFSPLALSNPVSCYSNDVCKGTAYWAAGTYTLGAEVKNDAGSLNPIAGTGGAGHEPGEDYYECIDAAKCSGSAALYEPGVGTNWTEAWERIGSCLNLCDPGCMYFHEDPPDTSGGSGGSSGDLPEWDGEPPVQACGHDVCTTGAALVNGCDPCVTEVCTLRASCCSTSWDSTCTDLAYTECANTNPPWEMCDFALFGESTINFSGGSVVGAPIGAANSGSASGNIVQVGGSASGNSVVDIVANGSVWLNSTTVTGEATYTGTLTTQNGSSVASQDHVASIDMPTEVPSKTVSCLTVSGSASFSSGTNVINPGDARQITLSGSSAVLVLNGPGSYGRIDFNADATIVFRTAGTYTFRQLNFSAGTPKILFPPTTAGNDKVNIDVCDSLYFQNNATVNTYSFSDSCAAYNDYPVGLGSYVNAGIVQNNGSRYQCTVAGWCNGAATAYEPGVGSAWNTAWSNLGTCTQSYTPTGTMPSALDVIWYTNQTSELTIGPNALVSGVLIAPHATVKFNGSSSVTLTGMVYAAKIDSNGQPIRINSTGLSGSACEDAGIFDYSPPTADVCPIPNVTEGVPPAINEPCATGLDCQINHRCVEPETDDIGVSCPHSKCMTGAAMTTACEDECVDRICDEMPSCCTTSWTQACVDKVATTCDAVCGDPMCDGNACTAGVAIESTCDPCIASVCTVLPSCCTTAWTATCVAKVYEVCSGSLPTAVGTGGSICDYAAYGQSQVQIQGANNTARNTIYGGGWVGSPTVASMAVQYVNLNTSNVTSSASLNLQYSDGSGHYVSGAGSLSTAFVTGTFSAIAVAPPSPTLPTRTFTCTGTATPTSGSIAPGSYGAVAVPNGQTLTLQAGTYNFTSLSLGTLGGTGATLALPSSGYVTINVCGKVNFFENSKMSGLSSTSAINLDIYTTGGFAAHGDNSPLYGYIQSMGTSAGTPSDGTGAGAGDIWIDEDSYHYGILVAQDRIDVRGGGNTTIDTRGLADDCKDRGLDGGTNPPVTTTRLCAYTGYGTAAVSVGSSSSVLGADLGSTGTVTLTTSSRVGGSVYTDGGLAVTASTARVDGEVRIGGTKSGAGAINIIGPANYSSTTVPDVTGPTAPFTSCAGGVGGWYNSSDWTNGPGSFGDVSFANRTAEFTATGNYTFNSFYVQQNTTIIIPESPAVVNLRSCGLVQLGESWASNPVILRVRTGPGVTRAPTAADAARFRIYSIKNADSTGTGGAIFLSSSSGGALYATMIAPFGAINLANTNTTNYGLAWGEYLNLSNSAKLDGTGVAGTVCKNQSVDTAPGCPVTLVPVAPDESAECVSNAVGYTDSTCAGYDLAAGTPCGSTVPICNHGTAAFSGSVTVGYWAQSLGMMSQMSPATTPTGTCTGTLSIAAGNCADLTCAIPSGTHSIMVDPNDALAECNDRRMDNWSVDDGRSCGGSATTAQYEYEAECPDGMAPLWSTLSWDTETPGSAQVIFRAKTAFEQADLASESFQVVGTARSSPDTQSCTITGNTTSGCPVDLAEELSLGNQHGSFLELEIEPVGAAVLREWQVSYSCVYDE